MSARIRVRDLSRRRMQDVPRHAIEPESTSRERTERLLRDETSEIAGCVIHFTIEREYIDLIMASLFMYAMEEIAGTTARFASTEPA